MVTISLEVSEEDYNNLEKEMNEYNKKFDADFDNVGNYILHLLDVLERDVY
jgi:hypothetical protein